MRIRQFKTVLALSVAGIALGACGADDIASPGEGVIVVPAPTPSPTPTPTPPTTPTPTPVPTDCPSGTTNSGTIESVNGTRRVCTLTGRINANQQISRITGVLYQLSGRVDVGTDIGGDGAAAGGTRATLTIDPGVTIFASSGLDYLVVNRGSQLIAEGTATNPIVFTARGNVVGSATDQTQGLWGGIILLGRAPISDCIGGATGGTAGCQQQIEGATAALYGGAVANDNSGRLRYVQIRYSGFEIATGNELQGLTTGGVGNGTTIEYVQVHNSSDDGVEFFGGRQNVRYLIVTGADDDSIDTDFGYKGAMQFVLAIQRAGGLSGDAIIEADSNGNEDAQPRQDTRISNFTFIHRSTVAASVNAVLLRGGTDYTLVNGIVTSPRFCFDIDGAATVQAANAALDELGPPRFNSVVAQCTQGAINDDGNVTAATIQSLFTSGANNNLAYTPTLSGGFVNGANEAAVAVFNPTSLSSFFVSVAYIGAVRDASDTWYRGWTCDSATAAFGSNAACTGLTGA